MHKPVLVASDIDGTLLTPLEGVSPRTREAVQNVVHDGTPFVLVTGRPPRWVPRIVEALGVAGPVVCSNGAVHYDAATDRILRRHEIGPVDLHDAVRELRRAIPGCWFAVERTEVADGPFLAEDGFQRIAAGEIDTAPIDEMTGHPAVKLLVLHEELASEEMRIAAANVLGTRFELTYSTGSGLIEVSLAGIDKAAGLAVVAEQAGVRSADTIAFGDMPNDIAMLEWAGHGVALRHAHPHVLDVADEVTGDNTEDGVAQVLERWW